MVFHPNDLGMLKIFLHISRYSVADLVQLLVELVQQPVVVDEPVLLVGVPVLVVSAKVVKAHWWSQDFLVSSWPSLL